MTKEAYEVGGRKSVNDILAETKIRDTSKAAKIDASEVGSEPGLDTGHRVRDGSYRRRLRLNVTAWCQMTGYMRVIFSHFFQRR